MRRLLLLLLNVFLVSLVTVAGQSVHVFEMIYTRPPLPYMAVNICECIGCSTCINRYEYSEYYLYSHEIITSVFENISKIKHSITIPIRLIYNIILFFLGGLALARAGDKLLKLNPLNIQDVIHLFMMLSVLPFIVYISLQISSSLEDVVIELG